MGILRVKRKLPFFAIPVGLAILTFLASWGKLFPPGLVETVYARRVFPAISRVSAFMADAIPFSWLDIWIPAAVLFLIYSVARRRWKLLGAAARGFLLCFFCGG